VVAPSVSPAVGTTHLFVIVMENTSFARAMANPYIAGLATQYAVATNYHAVGSPSLPNYLALTSGSTWGITDDGYHVLPADGIGAQLDQAGIPWRAYMDGLTSAGCLGSPGPYVLKHNPFAYYGGRCPSNVVPLDALAQDLVGATPNFVWITPDLCHDGHDCSLGIAADWLAGIVAKITASPAWNSHGTLFITWDEADGSTTLVPLIVVRPDAGGLSSAQLYDHYSLLATIEDALQLQRLGQAKAARPITDLVPQRP
jgi:phospholipase C